MITRSPKFFLQKALADSMSNLLLLMKYCVLLYIIQPSSVVLYTGKDLAIAKKKEKTRTVIYKHARGLVINANTRVV